MSGKNLFTVLDGLGNQEQNALFRLELDAEELHITKVKARAFRGDTILQEYKIPTRSIVDFGIVTASELKKQSVIGRGAVGGLLFGPVGAVLGGMSATGKQKIKSTLAICYLPSTGGEPKTIVFDAEPAGWANSNRVSILKMKNQLLKLPKSPEVLAYLGQTVNQDGSITL